MAEITNPGLSRATRRAIDEYISELREQLRDLSPEQFREAIADARAYFDETLPPSAQPEDVAAAAALLGGARGHARELREGRQSPTTLADPPSIAAGSVAGVPYDVRMPNSERLASRWWNPLDRRIFVPRVFGIGWDINFAAVSVRLGLIRPDDEDEPFAAVPDWWFAAMLSIPIGLTLAVVALAAYTQSGLPGQLPIHWGLTGVADAFAPKWVPLAAALAATILPTFGAALALARGLAPIRRAAWIAFATLFAFIGFAQYAMAVAWGLSPQDQDASQWPWLIAMFAGTLLVPFGELLILSRVGQAAERRRDLAEGRQS